MTLNPVNLNRVHEVKDDVEHQRIDNSRNNLPPTMGREIVGRLCKAKLQWNQV